MIGLRRRLGGERGSLSPLIAVLVLLIAALVLATSGAVSTRVGAETVAGMFCGAGGVAGGVLDAATGVDGGGTPEADCEPAPPGPEVAGGAGPAVGQPVGSPPAVAPPVAVDDVEIGVTSGDGSIVVAGDGAPPPVEDCAPGVRTAGLSTESRATIHVKEYRGDLYFVMQSGSKLSGPASIRVSGTPGQVVGATIRRTSDQALLAELKCRVPGRAAPLPETVEQATFFGVPVWLVESCSSGVTAGASGRALDSAGGQAVQVVCEYLAGELPGGDLAHLGVAVGRLIQSQGSEGWGDAILGAIGFVPIAGGAIKAVVKNSGAFGRAVGDAAAAFQRRFGGDAPAPGRVPDCLTNSFSPQTPVLLADGSAKRIADVRVGDRVLAGDPVGGRVEARAVTALIVGGGVKDLVDVTVGGARLTATDGHPFYVVDQEAWVEAGDLRPGDPLLESDGDVVEVDGVDRRRALATVHNLTVAGLHTYHVQVGGADVLVHNQSADCLPNEVRPARSQPPQKAVNATRGFQTRRFQFGGQQFQLDRSGMEHFLTRHHRDYWTGQSKTDQTFFEHGMSVDDVADTLTAVLEKNRTQLAERGGVGIYNLPPTVVNGITYVVGINNGRIGQFFPLPGGRPR